MDSTSSGDSASFNPSAGQSSSGAGTTDSAGSSEGNGELIFDIYDKACDGTWTDGFTMNVECQNPPGPGMPSSVGRAPNFMHPSLEPGPAVLMQPSAGNDGFMQGSFFLGDEFVGEQIEAFAADVLCITEPANEPCDVELQVRLLRGDQSLGTDEITTVTQGDAQFVIVEFGDAVIESGDELIIILFNATDSGDFETLVLATPILAFN